MAKIDATFSRKIGSNPHGTAVNGRGKIQKLQNLISVGQSVWKNFQKDGRQMVIASQPKLPNTSLQRDFVLLNAISWNTVGNPGANAFPCDFEGNPVSSALEVAQFIYDVPSLVGRFARGRATIYMDAKVRIPAQGGFSLTSVNDSEEVFDIIGREFPFTIDLSGQDIVNINAGLYPRVSQIRIPWDTRPELFSFITSITVRLYYR